MPIDATEPRPLTIADILRRAHQRGLLQVVGDTTRLALYGPPLDTTVIGETKVEDVQQ